MDIRVLNLKNMLHDNNIIIDVDENNNIIITGDIYIISSEYNMFPEKIYKVNGSITWKGFIDGFKYGSLSTLKNFPDIVTGNVNISKNKNLESLDYCPKNIGGQLCCECCNINSLSGLNNVSIGSHLFLSYNPITSIDKNMKLSVNGNIEFIGTNINKSDIQDIVNICDASIINTIDERLDIFD